LSLSKGYKSKMGRAPRPSRPGERKAAGRIAASRLHAPNPKFADLDVFTPLKRALHRTCCANPLSKEADFKAAIARQKHQEIRRLTRPENSLLRHSRHAQIGQKKRPTFRPTKRPTFAFSTAPFIEISV
jgi:hypothetical protein